jgi:hypothetical protein
VKDIDTMSEQRGLTRRAFLQWTSGAALALFSGGCASGARIVPAGSSAPSYVARLQIAQPHAFRILQFTDLHFFHPKTRAEDGKDARTVAMMRRLTDKADPHLILVTGDLWHENRDGHGEEFMRFAIARLEELGVPWAFTWGNHDLVSNYAAAHRAFTEARHSLYRGGDTHGNYVIEVVSRKSAPVWRVICLNSGQDGLGMEQRAFLKLVPDHPPALAACHIPIRQYVDIWEGGQAIGIYREDIGTEKEDGTTLAALKAAGVRTMICGHDHLNDYSGLADGVELIYGRSSGFSGYGNELIRKGAKLITIDCPNSWIDWISLTETKPPWKPKPGERIQLVPVKK